MPKGWVKVETVNNITNNETNAEKNRREKNFSQLIRNTKVKTGIQLNKESDELYAQKIAEEDSLLAAFEDKRLKSKKLIKQALRLKKERASAAEKASKTTEQKSQTTTNDKDEVTELPA